MATHILASTPGNATWLKQVWEADARSEEDDVPRAGEGGARYDDAGHAVLAQLER
jgi:hypothetical protein